MDLIQSAATESDSVVRGSEGQNNRITERIKNKSREVDIYPSPVHTVSRIRISSKMADVSVLVYDV